MMRSLWRRLTMTTTSPAAAGAAAAPPELQEDALRLVLAQLDGDVSALCASACVSTLWRDVLTLQPAAAQLWRALRMPPRVAARLTDERLRTLVARARGALERLDVSGCTRLTDEGIAAALSRQRSLAHFAAVGCARLSVEGVVRALKGRKLASLHVRGVRTDDDKVRDDYGFDDEEEDGGGGGDGNRAAAMVARELAQLRKRLRPRPHDLDATAGCTHLTYYAEHLAMLGDDETVCGRLCGEEDRVCESCDAYHCVLHRGVPAAGEEEEEDMARCARCDASMCRRCQGIAESLPGLGRHRCDLCDARHCPSCIVSRRAVAYAKCIGCGTAVCDACVRTLRVRVWTADPEDDDVDGEYNDGGGGGPGLRFRCGDAQCEEEMKMW
jgi:hypothetical protein